MKRISLILAAWLAGAGLAMAQDAPQALPTTPKVLTHPATETADFSVDVVRTSKGFLLGWINRADASGGEQRALVRSFSAKGVPLKPAVTLQSVSSFRFVDAPKFAALGGDKFAVIWRNTGDLQGGIFDRATNAITGIKTIATGGNNYIYDIVKLSNGKLAVAAMRIINVPEKTVHRALLFTFDQNLNKLSGPVSMNGAGYDFYLSSNDLTVVDGKTGGFVVYVNGATAKLFMRGFTPQGAAKGSTIRVNTTPLLPSTTSGLATVFYVRAVRLTDDRILVTWMDLESFDGTTTTNIRARFFTADGVPLGPDFRVNTQRKGEQNHEEYPEAVALPGGKVAILYRSRELVFGTSTYFMRIYDADGQALDKPRQTEAVTSPPPFNSMTMSAERLSDGSLIQVFNDTPSLGQRILADGIPEDQLN